MNLFRISDFVLRYYNGYMIPHLKNKTKQTKRFLGKTADWCMDLVFPKFCFGCKKEGAYLCADCKNRLRGCHSESSQQADKESQRSFTPPHSVQDDKSSIHRYPFCPICKNKIIFPQKCSRGCRSQINLALSPFSYDNFLIKDLIHNFKYNFIKSLGIDLGEFLIETIKNSPLEKAIAHRPENFLIVPVPLHRRRLAWRGFNQSEILAKEISEELGIKFSNVLKRIKNTKPQIEMVSADERLKNIQNAFVLKRNSKWLSLLSLRGTKQSLNSRFRGNNNIKNKTVILVDDMITTGATLEECAKILKQSGAREIWALTIAK